jgi:LacI family transcriptional regulator
MQELERTIRVLVDLHQGIGFHRDAFSGIANAVQAQDRVVLDLNWASTPLTQLIREDAPDGIITALGTAKHADQLRATGIPCVNVANLLNYHARIPVVGNDDQGVGRMVAEFYLDRGFQRFAYICGDDNSYFAARRDSFCERIASAGYQCSVLASRDAGHRGKADELRRVAGWLSRFQKPLAVMCPFDADARDVIQAAKLAGLRIPEDLSVVGVDNDVNMCLSTTPAITSVMTSAAKIGETALEIVLSLIRGKAAPEKPILVPPVNIVERGSTGEVAIFDTEVATTINYIRGHISERMTISSIVEHSTVSQRTLERKFLEAIGRTPLQELRRLRVERAKRLLVSTDLELKEIARRSGLIYVQRLARLVKEETGKSPAQFRRENKSL